MALVTREITNADDPLVDSSGTPLENVKITFQLVDEYDQPCDTWDATVDAYERVMPIKEVVYTNASGVFTINLWPNDRGSAVTQYRCTVGIKGVRPFVASLASGSQAITWAEFSVSGQTLSALELNALQIHESQPGLHGGGGTATDITYTELLALATAGGMTTGQTFSFPFKTVHKIPQSNDELWEGPEEIITVTAESTTTLKTIASSEDFPEDIIHYELVSGAANTIAGEYAYGRISYREDPIRNYKSYEDWRGVHYRRFTDGAIEIDHPVGSPATLVAGCVMLEYQHAYISFRKRDDGTMDWRHGGADYPFETPFIPTGLPQLIVDGLSFTIDLTAFNAAADWDVWSYDIDGGFYNYASTGVDAGYIDVYPFDNSRTPQGSMVSIGPNMGNALNNIVIGIGRFYAADQYSSAINIAEFVAECTLEYGVNVVEIGLSNGNLFIEKGNHHISIGMCCDGTVIKGSTVNVGENSKLIMLAGSGDVNVGDDCSVVVGANSQQINVANNSHDVIIGSGCSGINIESSFDAVVRIPDNTVGYTTGVTQLMVSADSRVHVDASFSGSVDGVFAVREDLEAAFPMADGMYEIDADWVYGMATSRVKVVSNVIIDGRNKNKISTAPLQVFATYADYVAAQPLADGDYAVLVNEDEDNARWTYRWSGGAFSEWFKGGDGPYIVPVGVDVVNIDCNQGVSSDIWIQCDSMAEGQSTTINRFGGDGIVNIVSPDKAFTDTNLVGSTLRLGNTVVLKNGDNFNNMKVRIIAGRLAILYHPNPLYSYLSGVFGGELVDNVPQGYLLTAAERAKLLGISAPPEFLDNADALLNGLVVGDIYRTATGVLMVVY